MSIVIFHSWQIDKDARAFIQAAQLTNPTHKVAVNKFVKGLKGANIWSKMRAVYLFIGGTEQAHKLNLKDPRDSDSAGRLAFVGNPTHNERGVAWDGISQYARTFITSNDLGYSQHMAYFSQTNSTPSAAMCEMGFYHTSSSTVNILWVRRADGGIEGSFIVDVKGNTDARVSIQNIDSRGFYIGSRTSASSVSAYKNGARVGANTATTAYNGNLEFYIGARNTDGVATSFSNRQCSFASIGSGLTDSEASILNRLVQNFQASVGRSELPYSIADNFSRAILSNSYVAHSPSTTTVGSGYLSFRAASPDGAVGRAILEHNIETASEVWSGDVRFSADTIAAVDYGVGIGLKNDNELSAMYYMAPSANEGKILIFNGTTILFTGTSILPPITGNTYKLSIGFAAGTVTVTVLNENTLQSITETYTLDKTELYYLNTGSPSLFCYSGTNPVKVYTFRYSDDNTIGIKTAFVGDSITWAHWVTQEERYASLLYGQDLTKYSVFAGPGDSSTTMINRMSEVYATRPQYCVILAGSNDGSPSVLHDNILAIVQGLKQRSITPIILKVLPRYDRDVLSLNAQIEAVALQEGVKILDTFTPFANGTTLKPEYDYGDQIHPNAAGHQLLADIISEECPEIL